MVPEKKAKILVIGYGEDICPPEAYELAYRAGKRIAENDAILITGGLGGVMEGASKGCYDTGGISIGIIPQDDKRKANRYCTVVIASGIGYARNFITAYSSDAIVVVGGGAGTLTEMGAAYIKSIPMVAVVESGGVAEQYAGKVLDQRSLVRVEPANGPEQAVDIAIRLFKNNPEN